MKKILTILGYLFAFVSSIAKTVMLLIPTYFVGKAWQCANRILASDYLEFNDITGFKMYSVLAVISSMALYIWFKFTRTTATNKK